MERLAYPGNKRFAFTILDDTDVATVATVKPVYDLLAQLHLGATKTVWPVACPEGGGDFEGSETLEDEHYLHFCRELQQQGFELTWHGATMQSSRRERTEAALHRFYHTFGFFPRIHVNHANNAENIYWGAERFDNGLLRFALSRVQRHRFTGHQPNSIHWWGDHCTRHITYARNLTFDTLNVQRINPTMPYRDPRRALVPFWFSAADADNADAFAELLRSDRQQALERDNGFCIVATHFGKEFVKDGEIDARVRRCLQEMAARNGWFPTVGELLDWLRAHQGEHELPRFEWLSMQWRWAAQLVVRQWRTRRRQPRNGYGQGTTQET